MELNTIIEIARNAGAAIMEIYESKDFSSVVDFKEDNSPLTLADKASHEVISDGLKKYFPHTPVISEEGAQVTYEERSQWKEYWLVDPLDGTKEFIKRNGEFTVNIALIRDNEPVAGVVYVPVKDIMYYGSEGEAAYKVEGGQQQPLKVNGRKEAGLTAVRSKSHANPEEEEILNKYGVTDSISVGSSLKFCMVAEGKADIYYRHGPTMEWDTAAGHAVVRAAGGHVMVKTGPDTFTYNKESLLNTSFLCTGW